MKRIFTLTAAALIAAPAAFAEQHMAEDEGMSMMQQRLEQALTDCEVEVEDDEVMNLTLAEVSGIIIESNSSNDQNEKCTNIRALMND